MRTTVVKVEKKQNPVVRVRVHAPHPIRAENGHPTMAPAATPSTASGVESWNHPVMAISVVYMQKEEGRNAEGRQRSSRGKGQLQRSQCFICVTFVFMNIFRFCSFFRVMDTQRPSRLVFAVIETTGLVRNDSRGQCGSSESEKGTNRRKSRTFQCSGRGRPTSGGRHATQTSYTPPCVRHADQSC